MSAELTDYQRGVLAGLGIKTTRLQAVYADICADPGVTVYALRQYGHPDTLALVERLRDAGLIERKDVTHPRAAVACSPIGGK